MPRRRSHGRALLLDPGRETTLLGFIAEGNRLQVAARLAGVNPATAEEWRRRGEGRDDRPAYPIYKRFAEGVATAEALAEQQAVAAIRAHMPRDYNAAKFWLQSRHPEVWGDKVAEQLGPGQSSGPVITGGNIIVITAEQAREMAGQQIALQRLESGISADTSVLDELSVGPDTDQQ